MAPSRAEATTRKSGERSLSFGMSDTPCVTISLKDS